LSWCLAITEAPDLVNAETNRLFVHAVQVHSLVGHVKRIVSGDFSPNGFRVATGGDDHSVRIWDLRSKACSYVLPAHSNLISECKFDATGEALLTASFDGTARVWGCRDWRLLSTMAGHEGKVMAADWNYATGGVITAGFDRTIKQWDVSQY